MGSQREGMCKVPLPRARTRLDDLEWLQGVVAGGRQASAWGHSPWHAAGTGAHARVALCWLWRLGCTGLRILQASPRCSLRPSVGAGCSLWVSTLCPQRAAFVAARGMRWACGADGAPILSLDVINRCEKERWQYSGCGVQISIPFLFQFHPPRPMPSNRPQQLWANRAGGMCKLAARGGCSIVPWGGPEETCGSSTTLAGCLR